MERVCPKGPYCTKEGVGCSPWGVENAASVLTKPLVSGRVEGSALGRRREEKRRWEGRGEEKNNMSKGREV